VTFKSRALVIADGAESAFYNYLGVPYSTPDMLAAFTSTEVWMNFH
jgi:flavin-dependent dehydrogenase